MRIPFADTQLPMDTPEFDMDDEMDVFLGRCLKNWAARQPLEKDGRERLLRAAARLAQDRQGDQTPRPRANPLRGLSLFFFEQNEYDPGLNKLWPIFTLSTLQMIPCGSFDLKYDSISSISGNAALMYLLHS